MFNIGYKFGTKYLILS